MGQLCEILTPPPGAHYTQYCPNADDCIHDYVNVYNHIYGHVHVYVHVHVHVHINDYICAHVHIRYA